MSEFENPELDGYLQNRPAYFLAIEVGNYRAAAREALRAWRRCQEPSWYWRFRGAFTRRNRPVR